ncbi:MAG: menaquinol oxidoreductase, partial [Deltaproteobacteria bacterium]|nr:menaquinol oxidoreductase [Deltaproteobacteria bacterium]
KEAIQSLAKIITYAMCVNVFFFGLELFTAFYSNIPGHMHPFIYLFYGMEGHGALVPFMWAAAVMAIGCLVLLIPSAWRDNENIMIVALLMLVGATWIDKGLALLVAGFVPNMFDKVTEYAPTIPELAVSMMVYATGALILTVLWKVAVSVKKEIA